MREDPRDPAARPRALLWPSLARGARDPAAIAAVIVLAGYFVIARLVENLYPFSTFPMYSGEHTDSASRIVAVEADGVARETGEYVAWSCEEPPRVEVERDRCAALGRYSTIPYIDREILERIRDRTGPVSGVEGGGAEVSVVRRVFRFPSGPGPLRVEDCAIGRCRAVRR